MKFRILILFVMLALAISIVPLIGAQDIDTCFGLEQADCDLLNQASANMLDVQSFNPSINLNFSLSGMPDTPDITFTGSGTGPVVLNTAGQIPVELMMDVALAGTGDGENMDLATSVIIKDDFLYAINPNTGEWEAVNLAEAGSEAGDMGLPFNPMDMDSLDAEALGLGDLDPDAAAELAKVLEVPGFITFTRLDTTTMMDASVIPFQLTIDVTALLNAPEFSDILATVSEMTGDESIEQMAPLLGILLDEGTITVTQYVGEDDTLIHGMDLAIAAQVSTGMLTGESDAPPIDLDLTVNIALDQINETFEITPPENFTVAE